MIKVKSITNTCSMCPSQWEGITLDGKKVYVRYRWGYLRVEVDDNQIYGKQLKNDSPSTEEHWQDLLEAGYSPETVESMKNSEKVMREFLGDDPFSYDGHMDYEELVQHTKDLIEWPIICCSE